LFKIPKKQRVVCAHLTKMQKWPQKALKGEKKFVKSIAKLLKMG
jgi:hypothetical protein